ncbi:putative disease resistance protein RGA4 isoform X2 [Oryza sativa Japonica Group]|uniref:putative disease resistance protein RGA4 isoform X2 n=1 Tax=Oryza sativa subsp. japonica TaxID=39947 RepID=UPI00077558DA|nr:disease resistance protein RGA2 [Oryza sativa Japonica Group]
MAEFLVRPLLSAVTNKASSYLVYQYKVMEGMEQQRKALERMLPLILSVIQDTEEKRSKKPELSAWLDELKKVSYEAIDVFDEFKYEALRREAKKKGHDATLGKGIVIYSLIHWLRIWAILQKPDSRDMVVAACQHLEKVVKEFFTQGYGW